MNLTKDQMELLSRMIQDHGNIDKTLEAQSLKSEWFNWYGLDRKSLESRFSGPDMPSLVGIKPVWDFRLSALERNDMKKQYDNSVILYVAERDAFLRGSDYDENYVIESTRRMDSQCLRVIGHWERGDALTPPVFKIEGGKLYKIDGGHRVKIALLAKAPMIPFYCTCRLSMDGISILQHPEDKSRWIF